MNAYRLPKLLADGRTRMVVALVGVGVGESVLAGTAAWAVASAFHTMSARASPTAEAPPALLWRVGTSAALLAAVGLGAAWLRGRERLVGERLGQHYVQSIRLTLADHLFATVPRDLTRRSTGAQTLRFTGDLAAVRLWISLGLVRLLVGIPLSLGCLTVISVIDPLAGLAVAVLLGAAGLDLAGQAKALRRANRRARRLRARLAADTHERVAQAAVVVGFGQQRRERRRIARRGQRLADAMIVQAGLAGRMRGRAELVRHVAAAVVLTVGALTAGTVAEIAAATTVLGFLAGPLRDAARGYQYWQGARVGVDRLNAVLARPTLPAPVQVRKLPDGPGRLDVTGLRVGTVLSNLDLVVEPGATVAITGVNGAGKSTLLAAIARLVVPDAGRVLLDGVDLAEVDLAELRRTVGLVSPDLPLLNGTLWHNVRYRHPQASTEELDRVRVLAGLDELLDSLPDGPATRVGEGGLLLSTGQRTRVALARALLGQPRLLLLDEPDARLDSPTRGVLDRALAAHPGTAVVVTHQPERLAADRLLNLADGHLVEVRRPRPDQGLTSCPVRDGVTGQLTRR